MEPLPTGLRQPDQRSCGAATVVLARMAVDPAYAARVAGHFSDTVLEVHRRVTRPVTAAGRLQVPWPRALGTPPWAIAADLSATTGTSYRMAWARTGRARSFERVCAAVASGAPVPMYVGSHWLPRHVVVAMSVRDDGLVVYDPAVGRRLLLSRTQYAAYRLPVGRWTTPWFVVVPK